MRSEGHLFLTVIAYQLDSIVIRKRLKQRGDPSSLETLRRILEGQQRVTVTLPAWGRADLEKRSGRKATRAEIDQNAHLRRPGHRSRSRRGPQDHRLTSPPIAGFNFRLVAANCAFLPP